MKHDSHLRHALPVSEQSQVRIAAGSWVASRHSPPMAALFWKHADGSIDVEPFRVFKSAHAAACAADWLGCGLSPSDIRLMEAGHDR